MTQFTIFKLKGNREDEDADFPGSFLDPERQGFTNLGSTRGPDFTATLYLSVTPPHLPRWAAFLDGGFDAPGHWPSVSSAAALLIVELDKSDEPFFAIPFGAGGRFLLRDDVYVRGYGLRTALNLIYASGFDSAGRMRTVSTKRRERNVLRAQHQANAPTDFEVFNVDRLREIVGGVNGRPADATWGTRIGGADALYAIREDIDFSDCGRLCRTVQNAFLSPDYKAQFRWIDFIQPVTDPSLRLTLEENVAAQLRDGGNENLGLAPPEVIDWDSVESFRLPHDRRARGLHRPDLHLEHYLSQVEHRDGLDKLDVAMLKRHRVLALDGDGTTRRSWTTWRCLYGELQLGNNTYILDEGDFFTVDKDYLRMLNEEINGISSCDVELPDSDAGWRESEYNSRAAATVAGSVLMDTKTVVVPSRTTPVELCDILTPDRHLIHVKRHLGSSDLSHLFSQGTVSAELLLDDADFRAQAQVRVKGEPGGASLDIFPPEGINPPDFEVVYGVVADWRGRTLSEALPFFSKVNLRMATRLLGRRRMRSSFARIQTRL